MKKLLTLFITLSLCFLGKSQWNSALDQNLLVSSPGGSSFAATTSDGKTYIGYWKSVPAPVNFELRLQILDKLGNKMLGTDGIKITDQIPMSTYTVVERTAVDANDNLYIGVTGTGAGNPGFVFKITPQGTSVWPNGISLGEAYLPTVLPLSDGNIVVGYFPPSQKYTKVQMFNPSGQAVWASPVQILADDTTKNTIPADLYELSNSECEIIFHKQLSFGTTSYLFAQKISLKNGAILWDGAKQITSKSTAYNAKYSGAVDGDVVYYGFSSGESMRFDGYLQRVNSDGSLPWGTVGVDFDTNQTYFEKDMKIAFAQGSSYIWSMSNYSSSSQGENGEFIQKFDKNTGARLLTDHAKQVFPIDNISMFHYGELQLVNNKPFFVVQKKETPTSLNVSLNAVMLESDGNFSWPQQYLPMATFSASKSYPNVLRPVDGQSVVVFQEKKSSDNTPAIYAQNLILPAGTMAAQDIAIKNSDMDIYPNPAVDVIHIKGIRDQDFSIYNAAGQLVKSGSAKQGEIEVRDLVKGMYILKIKGKEESKKFIKK
ncbi:T9SS type A sorting domain-containing protein [Chryseobacterium sp. Tr-659]|uniref:T9SS type A sorting domain-containing protein n=1 Tax=Chryseobacterium sp. Tr-659 TaxID=2608340 RepID=UPI00141E3DD7|nr:T9SS type A sorting domain-containing protein [Chryseobacterium sp. Tr-659]NIF03907.1 T9SS type A sorting domain-containing protein [Chryseobacterium sp. Tr-659]